MNGDELTLSEIRAKRQQLERDVARLVTAFNAETGLAVKKLHLYKTSYTNGSDAGYRVEMHVRGSLV